MILISGSPPETIAEEQLWQDYSARIYRYLVRLTGNAETAADLTQETFLQAIRDLRRMGTVPENTGAWLYRIAINRATDFFRRRRLIAWVPFVEQLDHGHAQDPAEAVAEHDLLFQALRRLPRQTAALLLLRDGEGFSAREIAEMTGENYEALRKRLARARITLRAEYLALKGEDA